MIYRIDVQITTPLYATEVKDRVTDAITTLFPGAEVEERHGELIGETHSLDHFAERLEEQAIVDTARELFFETSDGDTFSFDLKKQAAHEGVVNFAVGNPSELGEIHVRVRVEEPDVATFIEHIAPPTDDEDGPPEQPPR
ncbi:MAG: RNA-binding domain-containing protein [Halobacteriales archaeon]|nr:RNA-binding domain-containing protein [Halobacteriales archaeon]